MSLPACLVFTLNPGTHCGPWRGPRSGRYIMDLCFSHVQQVMYKP